MRVTDDRLRPISDDLISRSGTGQRVHGANSTGTQHTRTPHAANRRHRLPGTIMFDFMQGTQARGWLFKSEAELGASQKSPVLLPPCLLLSLHVYIPPPFTKTPQPRCAHGLRRWPRMGSCWAPRCRTFLYPNANDAPTAGVVWSVCPLAFASSHHTATLLPPHSPSPAALPRACAKLHSRAQSLG